VKENTTANARGHLGIPTIPPVGFRRATVSGTFISHKHNFINGGSIPGNPFHTLKIPKLTEEIQDK
jgi:hypothetical protein